MFTVFLFRWYSWIYKSQRTLHIPKGERAAHCHFVNEFAEFACHCLLRVRQFLLRVHGSTVVQIWTACLAREVDFLRKAGFRKVLNLKGGILAWSDQVDPSVPKY